MTERKHCARCERAIDAWSSICPFCNWDQNQPAPPPDEVGPTQARTYVAPKEHNVRRMLTVAGGIVIMLVGAFLIGMLINRDGAPKRAPESLEQQAAEHNAAVQKPMRADTPLVEAGQGGLEQPITSAPVVAAPGSTPSDYDRTDATAVGSDEYARIAKLAEAEKKKKAAAAVVDPLSLTGPAYAQGRTPASPRAGTPAPAATPARPAPRASASTRPVPQYQPLPGIRAEGKARFTLIVGSDGRVREVNIDQALRNGNTAAVVRAMRSWRFKPATVNGEPVTAPYSVELSFKRD